jgi:CheY-like chemotaxis protein
MLGLEGLRFVCASEANAIARVVLVVEDEFLLRCSITESLREVGYTVLETASGEEALALSQSGMSIDIVFTDINLIGAITGWDVAESLRAAAPSMSVLYTSGEAVDPARCVSDSMLIAKPYLHGDVLEACQRLSVK